MLDDDSKYNEMTRMLILSRDWIEGQVEVTETSYVTNKQMRS